MAGERAARVRVWFSPLRWVALLGGGRGEALAVVLNDEGEGRGVEAEADFDLGGAGVFDDVVQRFLNGEEKIMADFSAERVRWQRFGKIEAATDASDVEIFLRELADSR